MASERCYCDDCVWESEANRYVSYRYRYRFMMLPRGRPLTLQRLKSDRPSIVRTWLALRIGRGDLASTALRDLNARLGNNYQLHHLAYWRRRGASPRIENAMLLEVLPALLKAEGIVLTSRQWRRLVARLRVPARTR